MRCLYMDCPMGGRQFCPATSDCPKYRRALTVRHPEYNNLYLAPEEAIKLYDYLGKALSFIDDMANPPEYWPLDKDGK